MLRPPLKDQTPSEQVVMLLSSGENVQERDNRQLLGNFLRSFMIEGNFAGKLTLPPERRTECSIVVMSN